MVWVYILIILLFRVVQAIFGKRSSIEVKNSAMLSRYVTYQYALSAFIGLAAIIVSGEGIKIDLLTVGIAALSGVSLLACSSCSIYAMKSGTVSLNSMFGTAGMLIPIAAGAMFFGQPVSVMQWVGLAGFFVSSFFLIKGSKKIYAKFDLKTALLLIGCLVSNGVTMLAQQMFTRYVPNGSVSAFSFISFAIVALLGLPISAAAKRGLPVGADGTRENSRLTKSLFVCGAALAVSLFIINQFATISTSLISPVILFTFINGGGTIISTVVASIMYKEKLSFNIITGVILGIASLVVIKSF